MLTRFGSTQISGLHKNAVTTLEASGAQSVRGPTSQTAKTIRGAESMSLGYELASTNASGDRRLAALVAGTLNPAAAVLDLDGAEAIGAFTG